MRVCKRKIYPWSNEIIIVIDDKYIYLNGYLIDLAEYERSHTIKKIRIVSRKGKMYIYETLEKQGSKYPFTLEYFLELYTKNYEEIYSNEEKGFYTNGSREALYYFDNEMSSAQKELLKDFCRYRGDLITSDRECEAFVFTLEDLAYGDEEE